jgi:hypothetical protein
LLKPIFRAAESFAFHGGGAEWIGRIIRVPKLLCHAPQPGKFYSIFSR